MFLMCAKITLGNYYIPQGYDIKVVSSWKNLTDTAVIKLPRAIRTNQGQKLDDVVHRGDTMAIELGYDNNLKQIFTGYVDAVSPAQPVVISCQNEVFKWKQKAVKTPKLFVNPKLADILTWAGFKEFVLLGDVSLVGNIYLDATVKNAAGVLDIIVKQLFMPCFFRDGMLYVGKPYNPATSKRHHFSFNYNIIEHDLVYKRKEDINIKVTAISKTLIGKDITYPIGSSDGEEHTLHFFNYSLAELKRCAAEEYERLTYNGYRGSFTTFGEPVVQHGDIVHLYDPEYQEKEGEYYVESVETNFSDKGYRQVVTLGLKSSDNG